MVFATKKSPQLHPQVCFIPFYPVKNLHEIPWNHHFSWLKPFFFSSSPSVRSILMLVIHHPPVTESTSHPQLDGRRRLPSCQVDAGAKPPWPLRPRRSPIRPSWWRASHWSWRKKKGHRDFTGKWQKGRWCRWTAKKWECCSFESRRLTFIPKNKWFKE